MRDERFKTQLFRFVDVVPALTSSGETSRYLKGISRLGCCQLFPGVSDGAESGNGRFLAVRTGDKGPGVVARAAVHGRQYRGVKS
jgi:hypothetical protein